MGRIFETGEIRNDRPGHRTMAPRSYPGYALVYVTRLTGEGHYEDHNGFRRRISAHDCILVHPERTHVYGPRDGAVWSEIYISFDGPVFSSMQRWGVLDPSRPPVFATGAADHAPRLRRCVMDETGEPPPMAVAVGRLVSLLTELTRVRDAGPSQPVENWITLAGRALEREGATVAEVCDAYASGTGLSPDALRKRYRRVTGESMDARRLKSRLAAAITLIEQGSAPFKNIAYTLGFSNEQHFSRTISRATGFTPGALRARSGFQRPGPDE